MNLLSSLAQKYGTDKFPSYTSFYDTLLRPHRHTITSVLEIGIGTVQSMSHVSGYQPGASLRLWRDYFPNAQILGVDIDERVLFQDERITTRMCNQANREHLKTLVGEYDLIVDDGSHHEEHQLLTFKYLFPSLRPGGFYIIEDVNFPEAVSHLIRHDHSIVLCRPHDSKESGQLILIRKNDAD